MEGGFLFAAAAGLAAAGLHPFVTYPASLVVLARLFPRETAPATDPRPAWRVAHCVCAYNEASLIADKARNMIAQGAKYPGVENFIYVDAASDATAAILAEFAPAIHVTVSAARLGKTAGMNRLVAGTTADIVVFSDANVMFAPDAIHQLVAAFDDPDVGCVCGHLKYSSEAGGATAEVGSLYWRLEELIKRMESRTGSTMGADGSIFAIRRALHQPPPPDIIDDMFVSLSILCAGWRVIRAESAVAYEPGVSSGGEEFRRKVRIACQAFNVNRLLRPRLAQLSALNRYKYVSHKWLRWLAVFSLLGATTCGIGGLMVRQDWGIIGALLSAGMITLAWARAAPRGPAARILDIAAAFLATGLGVLRSMRGDKFQTWTPPASARAATSPP